MKTAWIAIKELPAYRRDAFASGLRACGYDVKFGDFPAVMDSDTVYCCWNRYWSWHETANRVEAAGGTVLVAENAYLKGPKDGGDYFALARHAHNGAGQWPSGGPERWNALGIDLKPWRTDGGHILLCPNRTFGMPGLAMPGEWPAKVKRRLGEVTKREIRVRPHPGNDAPQVPLERDLENCWAVCIWASSVGVKALIAGVPVICDSPHWICKGAAYGLVASEFDRLNELHTSDLYGTRYLDFNRLRVMHALAHAQWNVNEIASGEPFRSLLRAAEQEKVAAPP